MEIWFKTLLLFVGFNKVDLYRQLMNTTCLELAKPSNKHLRLSCNDSSIYHCLLNGNSTNEFEICKKWKWIPEGTCAYLNEYGWNIDARRCSSSAELACPKTLYRSEETIQYAACYVKKNTNSKPRQVQNTTCLELAKPSNQQFRLSCNNIGTYHCLLDQSYTKEFEICKMWKWIPKGKCAYYSMYSGGNIEERNCTSSSHFVCPEQKYRSENITNYFACYRRNSHTTVQPLTSSFPVTLNRTSSDGNGGDATSYRISETAEKHIEIKSHVLPSILGIIVPAVSIAVIWFILYIIKGNFEKRQESSDKVRNEGTKEHELFVKNGVEDTTESPPTMRHEDEYITEAIRNAYPVESPESSNSARNEDIKEHEPFLRKEVKDTQEIPPTMRHEDKFIAEARRNGNSGGNYPADVNESDSSEHFEDASSPLTSIIPKNPKVLADEQELCAELYNLLSTEGLKLTQGVMAATITRNTGKSVKTLSNSLTNEEKRKLKEVLPIEFNRILESQAEHGISFDVSYGLLRIYLDEEKSPKSGWGNPVKETDISIGDDVERLYMIQTIVRGIGKPDSLSVESYIRLLDIMIEALTRLDPDDEFKDNVKAFTKRITCLNTITQNQ